MKEKEKKASKGILRSVFVGLVCGLMLCLAAYVVLVIVYKQPTSTVTSGKTAELKDEEYEPIDQSKYNINSNEAHVAAMTASETLIPEEVQELFKINAPSMEISNVQGGCTDGTYFWQAFYAEDKLEAQVNNQCVIVKYDMKTKKVVATSEVMQLNHANDLTYNSKLGYIVVCHNAPLNNLITFVDADTLEYVDTIATNHYIFSIAYNETRDQYVVGLSGTKTFRILDADFNAVTEANQASKAYKSATNQGGACDDDYIYFVYYKQNVVVVYDWDGNYVTGIELDTKISPEMYEPESIQVLDGEMYINCGQGEATIFKVSDFVPKPEEVKE